MATLMDYLTRAVQEEASDLFIVSGAPVSIKLEGQLRSATDREIYTIAKILNVPIELLFQDVDSNE